MLARPWRLFRLGVVFAAGWLAMLAVAGCESHQRIDQQDIVTPRRVRLHPTFTQIKDWTGDGKADGIEAVVEILDEFDEPIRASGTLLFELYDFEKRDPNPAQHRVLNPWNGSLLTKEDQAERWSLALRAYTFQLAYPKVSKSNTYVLKVTFETPGGASRPGGGRLFDQIVLEPADEYKKPDRIKRGGSARPQGASER